MKRIAVHITILVALLLGSLLHAYAITYPATIWFLDGTIKCGITHLAIDSASQTVVYLYRDRFKTAFFDEIFAITSEQDTLIFTDLEKINFNNMRLRNCQMFQLLQGIHDGLTARHYRTFFTSLGLSYFSNIAFINQNVLVRNIPNLVNFFFQCSKTVEFDPNKSFYEIGYNIGLQKRKVIETAAGIVVGTYMELATEAILTNN